MKLIRCLFSALALCVLVLLPPMEALAQSENSEMQPVEVPQALGPEAMQALVSKLNDKQTAALVELIQLLDSSAGNSETTSQAEQRAEFEIIEGWITEFGNSLNTYLHAFPEMITSLGSAISVIFQRRDAGGNLKFLLLLAVILGVDAGEKLK